MQIPISVRLEVQRARSKMSMHYEEVRAMKVNVLNCRRMEALTCHDRVSRHACKLTCAVLAFMMRNFWAFVNTSFRNSTYLYNLLQVLWGNLYSLHIPPAYGIRSQLRGICSSCTWSFLHVARSMHSRAALHVSVEINGHRLCP